MNFATLVLKYYAQQVHLQTEFDKSKLENDPGKVAEVDVMFGKIQAITSFLQAATRTGDPGTITRKKLEQLDDYMRKIDTQVQSIFESNPTFASMNKGYSEMSSEICTALLALIMSMSEADASEEARD